MLVRNGNYRRYLASHVCQHAGDWFVHVASLVAVNRLAPNSGVAVSLLVLTKTIPDALLTPVGGALADSFDRRRLMVGLDLAASLAVLGYVAALAAGRLDLFLVAHAVRSTLHALYEPVTRSIVPSLVRYDVADLQRATTIHSSVWSTMMIIGGYVGGYATGRWGLRLCYGEPSRADDP